MLALFIVMLVLFAASSLVGRWVSTASASVGPVTARPEAAYAPASQNDNDDLEDLCSSDNPRKQKKCNYNTPNVDNDNDNSADQAPSLGIAVSTADPRAGDSFSLTLHATGRDLDQVWWWVPDVVSDNGNDNGDDSWLADSHAANCDGSDDCSRSWDLKASHTGTITIHAKARDREGRESSEVTTEVRVHS
jgi:hypothetical protein